MNEHQTCFLASNSHQENKVALVSRRLKNGQRITIDCPKAIEDFNQFAPGVDLFNQRISCYSIDRKFKRNWPEIFFLLNASIFIAFICYKQLPQNKITYLNYMVSVAKFLCSGSERTNRGRAASEKKAKLPSPKTTLGFEDNILLPVKGKRRGVHIAVPRKQKRDLILSAFLANEHFV